MGTVAAMDGRAPGLWSRADDLDAARFVGRRTELDGIAAARTDPGLPRIIYVHGDGGVGKSALLRAAAREAAAAGAAVLHLDGRSVGGSLEHLDAALEGAAPPPSLVLIDELDEVPGPGRAVRDRLLAGLDPLALLVIAGRRPPGREWYDDGVAHLLASRRLGPLDDDDARELLARLGTAPPNGMDAIVAWSGGSPLALVLGCRLDGPEACDAALGEQILEHLDAEVLTGIDPEVLELAAIARTIDGQMLAAVLPGRPVRAALHQLRASTVTERVGARVALHDLVRRAVLLAPSMRRHELIVRLADHLVARIPDDPMLVVDLAALVQSRELRSVLLGASDTYVADRARPGDVDAVAGWCHAGGAGWVQRMARWSREAPTQVVCARTGAGSIAGIAVTGALDEVPAWAAPAIEIGPVRDHAAAAGVAHDALFMHDMHLEAPDGAPAFDEARMVLIGAAAIGHGVARRHMFFTSDQPMPPDCADAFGYREVVALRRRDGERELRTWAADMGPDGIVGQIRRTIGAEQGAPAAAAPEAHHADAVLRALRAFHDDGALARNRLAGGEGAAEARRRVVQAADRAFGDTGPEVLLRQSIECTYLRPDGGPELAMRELHVSRSTLYRLLKQARARMAHVIEQG